MTKAIGDSVWMLAFFPVWAAMAGVWFGVAAGPKRCAGIRMRKFLDSFALVLSICSATAILISLNCESVISMPFAQPACAMVDFSRIPGSLF